MSDNNKSIRKTVYLSPDLHKRLKILSIESDKDLMQLIDESVYFYLENIEKNKEV